MLREKKSNKCQVQGTAIAFLLRRMCMSESRVLFVYKAGTSERPWARDMRRWCESK